MITTILNPTQTTTPTGSSTGDPSRLLARAAVTNGVLGIALIHLIDLHSKFNEVPYQGVAFLLLIGGSLLAAAWLTVRDDPRAWLLSGVLALATIAAYSFSRSIGLPSAGDDIGNWLEPLGVASLFVEGFVVLVSGYMLFSSRAATRPQPPA